MHHIMKYFASRFHGPTPLVIDDPALPTSRLHNISVHYIEDRVAFPIAMKIIRNQFRANRRRAKAICELYAPDGDQLGTWIPYISRDERA